MKLFPQILTLIFLIPGFSALAAAGSIDIDLTGWESFRSGTVRTWEDLQNAGPEAIQWETDGLTSWTSHPDLICWYRTNFDSPKLTDSQRAFLAFEWVKFGAQVRIDGKDAGHYTGGAEPFELDVTNLVRDGGKHSILIRVEGVTAITKNPPESLKTEVGHRTAELFHGNVMAPVGSHGFSNVGLRGKVTLEVRDTLKLEDLFIQTSWREKKISVDLEFKNLTGKEVSAPVTVSVPDPDDPQKSLIEFHSSVSVLAGQSQSVHFENPWKNPRVWSPRDPFLYFLDVKLGDFLTHRERFGFREIWCDGDRFVLNGVPFRALGTAAHPGGFKDPLDTFRRLRRANINCMRLHANIWPKEWIETADETGMLLILEGAFFCWCHSYALEDPEFWVNYDRHIRALQKKHRNNPSFCFLSMENEIAHCGGERILPNLMHVFAEAGKKAKTFDSTRPISYDGDMDPEGVADVVNTHYPMDYAGIRPGNEDQNWPHDCWWMDDGKFMACYPNEFWKWDRKKPFYIGEFLHIQHFTRNDPYSLVLGDEAYSEEFGWVNGKAKGKTWSMQIPAYRAAGVTGLCPWVITEYSPAPEMESEKNPRYAAVRDAYEPVNFILEPLPAEAFAETVIQGNLWLVNDSDCPREVKFGVGGKTGVEVLGPAERKRVALEIPASLIKNGRVKITLTHKPVRSEKPEWNPDWSKTGGLLPKGEDHFFLEEGKVEREVEILVAQRADYTKTVPYAQSVAVLGASDLAKGLGAVEVKDLNDPALAQASALIIGKNQLQVLAAAEQKAENPRFVVGASSFVDKLNEFLGDPTHKVIILEQDEYPAGLFPVHQTKTTVGDPRNTAFTEYPAVHHPFLFPENAAFEPYVLNGNQVRLGGPNGFEYCPILRHRNLILCQFPVSERWYSSPSMAAWLERFLQDDLPQTPQRKLAVIDPTGQIQKTMTRLGFEVTSREDAPEALTLVNAASEPVSPRPGEQFVLFGLTPENLPKWKSVLPASVSLQPFHGPVIRKEASPACEDFPKAGLAACTSCDLYWTGSRKGLTNRQMTPVLQVADWQIMPFEPDFDQRESVPYYGFDRFATKIDRPRHVLKEENSLFVGVNQTLETEIDCPQGWSFLEIEGRGTTLQGVGCILDVRLDSHPAGIVEMLPQYEKKGLFVKCAGGKQRLSITFTNDLWDPVTREDRNLYFRGVRLIPLKRIEGSDSLKIETLLEPTVAARIAPGWVIDCVKCFAPDEPTPRADRYIRSILSGAGISARLLLGGTLLGPSDWEQRNGPKPWKVTETRGVPTLGWGTNGSLVQNVTFLQPGHRTFTLRASGSQCMGEYPHVNLRLDGKVIGEFDLDSEDMRDWTISPDVEIPAGEHEISLQFTNDLWDPETRDDRNIHFESFRIQ